MHVKGDRLDKEAVTFAFYALGTGRRHEIYRFRGCS